VCFPAEYEARRAGEGDYVIDDTVNVAGRVGLQALTVDLLNADSGRLAPRSIEIFVDDSSVSRIVFSTFSFAHAGEVGFVYDEGRIRTRREYVYQLYERTGESLWNRKFVEGGRLPTDSLDSGRVHEVRVLVTDAAGESSELRAHVRTGLGNGTSAAAFVETEMHGAYFHEDLMVIRDQEPPRIVQASDLADKVLSVPLPADPGAWYVAALRAGVKRRIDFHELGLSLVHTERTAYTDNTLYAVERAGPVAPKNPELSPRFRSVRIGPYSLSLRADVEIRFAVGSPDTTDAIYRQSERSGKWVHYASTIEGDTVSTTAKRPGVYGVFSDETAPTIKQPRVARRLIYASGAKIPEIVIPIVDEGSGVDYKRCAVFVDGIKQIARWDVRAKKLFVLIRDVNIMGPRAMSIVAYDNIGHRSQLDTTIDILRRK
jgi:hypothetical protein